MFGKLVECSRGRKRYYLHNHLVKEIMEGISVEKKKEYRTSSPTYKTMMNSINAMGEDVDFDFPTSRCEMDTD